MQPPPQIVRVSFTVSVNTHNASCNDLSASSNKWLEAPLSIIEHAVPVLHPENLINLSSPITTSSISLHSPKVTNSGLAEIEEAEKDKMRVKCNKIIDHGINCFINRQLIYNFPEQIFTEHNVVSIEHADFDGIERLAAVTGGEISSTFDKPELVTLGECKLIDEVVIGEDKLIRFSGCKTGTACSIILRGASSHLLEEAERSLHDALCVLTETVKETRTICGGGCMEMLMANAIDKQVPSIDGKAALAMEAFSRALRQLPTIIADNGGYDSSELVTQLRAAHNRGESTKGLDMTTGTIGDMIELGIRESYKSKLQVLVSAAEAAEMILRVDDIIKCAPRQRQEQ
jgi:T-complex protein 1 subunit beta